MTFYCVTEYKNSVYRFLQYTPLWLQSCLSAVKLVFLWILPYHCKTNCLRGFCTRFDQNDKPGYVWSDHLSSPDVATRLKRPTRKPAGNRMLSVRSCFGWGLHSLLCYQTSGSLLHCLFTLTLAGGYFLLHFPGSHLHRTLSGILPYEARTFLTCSLSFLQPRSLVLLKPCLTILPHFLNL